MAKKLSPWCKRVKIELIERDLEHGELADKANMSKEYVSAVVNGRVYSPKAIQVISEILNIDEEKYPFALRDK